MERTVYSKQQVKETEKLITAIQSIPTDKRAILTAMTEAFIGGMRAQERLTASGKTENANSERRT